MRTSWLFLVTMLVSPAVGAQVYVPPPPMGSVPPHVYIRERIHWHLRHHRPVGVYVSPAPPPVWVAPASPPPPVYITPPPVIIQPQTPYYVYPQPIYGAPPYGPPPVAAPAPPAPAPVVVVEKPAKPQWEKRFGIGVTGEGMFVVSGHDSKGGGILGQLRYRAARHLALELMSGYERSTDLANKVRTDVPVTLGLMIHILGPEYVVSPYLVGAGGVNFVNLRLLDAPTLKIDDDRIQAIAQAGAGLELRLGRYFAINGDVRLEGRWGITKPKEAAVSATSIDGKAVHLLEDSMGVRAGLGATLYF